MRSHRSSSNSSDSLTEMEHSLHPNCLVVSGAAEPSDIKLPLMEKRLPSSKSTWLSDTADLFILLCSFLFITVSIVLFALVLQSAVTLAPVPPEHLSILQRIVAAFSVSITTAVMMVIGKRYVLFKLAREGLRSRRVAVYSNLSIGNLARHTVLGGTELPLLGLLAVWGLALATSLTVNDTWEIGSMSSQMTPPILSGSLNTVTSRSSYLLAASGSLSTVLSSLCVGFEASEAAGLFGLIKVTDENVATDHPTGAIFYPAPPQWARDIGFSYSTTMNAFNISMEELSSVPPTAQNLTCTTGLFSSDVQLWSDGSDNQTLSIIVVDPMESSSVIRFNATAIIVGGTFSSTGDSNYKEFALNGTSSPNIMSTGNQWAEDITTLICNTTCPTVCGPDVSSLYDFTIMLNYQNQTTITDGVYVTWSSIFNIALGAYSSAVLPSNFGSDYNIPITMYNRVFTTRYGLYILISNIVVSIIMLIITLRLRLASPLGSDFINSTRLLLNPLQKPELFNASLDRTVEELANPYMMVREDNVFLLVEEKSMQDRKDQTLSGLRRWNPF